MKRLLVFTLLISSCSSLKDEERFNSHIESQQCDQALLSNEPSVSLKLVDGAGSSASYLVSGLGYASDLIITVGTGVIVGVTLCSPIILLEAGIRSGGHISGECFAKIAGKGMKESFMNLGEKAYENTSSWRCPNLDVISEGIRKVASCYERRGEIEKSIKQLKKARYSREFNDCISEGEKAMLDNDLKRLGISGLY